MCVFFLGGVVICGVAFESILTHAREQPGDLEALARDSEGKQHLYTLMPHQPLNRSQMPYASRCRTNAHASAHKHLGLSQSV